MLTSGILLLLMGRLRGSVTATRGDWKAAVASQGDAIPQRRIELWIYMVTLYLTQACFVDRIVW